MIIYRTRQIHFFFFVTYISFPFPQLDKRLWCTEGVRAWLRGQHRSCSDMILPWFLGNQLTSSPTNLMYLYNLDVIGGWDISMILILRCARSQSDFSIVLCDGLPLLFLCSWSILWTAVTDNIILLPKECYVCKTRFVWQIQSNLHISHLYNWAVQEAQEPNSGSTAWCTSLAYTIVSLKYTVIFLCYWVLFFFLTRDIQGTWCPLTRPPVHQILSPAPHKWRKTFTLA